MKVDLADLSSIRAFTEAYASKHSHLDILVNNAGVNVPLGRTTVDGFEMMWGTNHLAVAKITHELMPLLLAAPNRAVVSTCSSAGAGFQAPPGLVPDTDQGLPQSSLYARSKAANLVFTAELQRRFDSAGVKHVRALSSHPGWTYTGLMSNEPLWVKFLNYVCSQNVEIGTTPQLASVGAGLLPADHPQSASEHQFFGPCGRTYLWGPPISLPMFRESEAKDPELGLRLWNITNKAVGIVNWNLEGKGPK